MRTLAISAFAIHYRSVARASQRMALAGPCSLVAEAVKAWAERNVSTGFLIACILTALVWTSSLAIAMLQLVALATRP